MLCVCVQCMYCVVFVCSQCVCMYFRNTDHSLAQTPGWVEMKLVIFTFLKRLIKSNTVVNSIMHSQKLSFLFSMSGIVP